MLRIRPGKKSGKSRKINKMAVISTNIAEELYAILVNDPYEEDVQVIEADTQPSPDELKESEKTD